MNTVRQPAVAGLFYPDSAQELSRDIKRYLQEATLTISTDSSPPKAIIVPHAGYRYSGLTAAYAYASIIKRAKTINRVVLLGPAHKIPITGLAVMNVKYFRTPLGDIPQHSESIQKVLTLPQVNTMDTAHWQEHSLEVQLPFLQTVLSDFELVAIVVGEASPAEVDQVLSCLWGGDETLIVISSDLSHFNDYNTAQYIDRSTCDAIEHLDIDSISSHQACGCAAVKGLLRAAKSRNMSVHTLALTNSGDSSGEHGSVVGYGSWAFEE